ncbi:MAG: chromosomal replication initiator protein DnaA [Candidatus Omnitrophota bacterium]
MDLIAAWKDIQSSLREKVGVTTYETWFSSLSAKEKNPSTLIIGAPDEFFKNWIIEHYGRVIKESFDGISSKNITIEFEVNPQILKKGTQSRLTQLEKGFQTPDPQQASLNPRFHFDSFVIGSSNRFAYAACLAVAESPAKAYNPLFIYGGVGLGKTHLMQAITHKIKEINPKSKHCYMTSERFTNELIDAIRHRATASFRQKYRNMDVLLIDDIHFIAGKESTQEEFFHTFNTLHDNHKQIIIASDRPPKAIANLEERLTSRFTWGLITDIQPPDFETRAAILRKKIEREPVQVPDDVIVFIAQEIKTNIRELEGALIRVAAYSLLEEKTITLDMAKLVLKDMVMETSKIISIDMIQKAVANHFNVALSDLRSKRRNKNIVLPRQVAMYLSRQLTNFSFPEIGGAFGGKDHTTVLHSCKKIDKEMSNDKKMRDLLEQLSTEIKR